MAQTRTRGPHATPRTAVVWEVLTAELARQGRCPLAVVDVGGGTGGFAVPLAEAGHRVTVVDPSPDALASLTRRAAEAGVADRVTAVQGDGDRLADLLAPGGADLAAAGSADLVLCHSLLEVVDDPASVLRAVAGVLRPGGAASVLVANQVAAVLARAMAGHLVAVAAALSDPDELAGPAEAPGAPAGSPATGSAATGSQIARPRRFDVAAATALLAGAGLTVEEIHGVRVLTDLVPAAVAEAELDTLLGLETRLAGQPPYRDIAAQLHLLARRPAR